MKRRQAGFALAALAVTAAPALAGTKTVGVQDNFFQKKSVSVAKGDQVKWDWSRASNPHNVTFTSVPKGAVKKHSKTQSSGSFSYTFKKAGKYKYECTIHADSDDMKGTVTVK